MAAVSNLDDLGTIVLDGDLPKKDTPSNRSSGKSTTGSRRRLQGRRRGCRVDCCMGLSIAVAACVLVGLIVLLLASVSPDSRCSCPAPTDTTPGTPALPTPEPQVAKLWQQCRQLAEQHGECIGACPRVTMAPTLQGGRKQSTETNQATSQTPRVSRGSGSRFQSSEALRPSHYNLEVTPLMFSRESSFNGVVQIFITCQQSTEHIVLHSKKLGIDVGSVSFRTDPAGQPVPWTSITLDESKETVTISTATRLAPGSKYILQLHYNGTFGPGFGLSREVFQIPGKIPTFYIISQLAPANARSVFPCFDEPSFKATFNVTLVTSPRYTALSNMPLRETLDRARLKASIFHQTPPMSTCHVALTVLGFDFRETTTVGGTAIRIWAPPEYLDYADFALRLSKPILEAIETYTGIKYPLPKIDQVVAVGANLQPLAGGWGLILYQTPDILYDRRYSTTADRLALIATVGVKLAEQWFSHLVTMDDRLGDLLASESLPSYIGRFITMNESLPESQAAQVFSRQMESVMQEVSERGRQEPMADGRGGGGQPDRPQDVDRSFASEKGAVILRMVEKLLGPATFQRGIQNYLMKNAYGTVTTADLYRALNLVAQEEGAVTWDNEASLGSIVETWLKGSGVPVVDVSVSETGTLRATRNVPSPTTSLCDPWYIPFTAADVRRLTPEGARVNITWVSRNQPVRFIDGLQGVKVANVFRRGYYRVNYSQAMWRDLMTQLETDHEVIPVENRAEIIDDAAALARSGQLLEAEALESTKYLQNETYYAPWWAGLNNTLPVYDRLLSRTPTYALLNNYILGLVVPPYERLGWNSSDADEFAENSLRAMIVAEVCKRDHLPCVDHALRLFRNIMDGADITTIPPEFRRTVYCTAMAHGWLREFSSLRFRFETYRDWTNSAFQGQEVDDVLAGLSCVRSPMLIDQVIDMGVTRNLLPLITRLAEQPAADQSLWAYLTQHWAQLHKGPLAAGIPVILDKLTDRFSTNQDLSLLVSFLRNHSEGLPVGFNDTLIRKVEENVAWMTSHERPIRDWLEAVGCTKGLGTCPTAAPPATVAPPGGRPSRPTPARLDRSLLPDHYNLELKPRMYPGDDFRFDGRVEIFMTCEHSTNVIVLHTNDLVIDEPSVNLRRQDGTGSIIQWRQLQMNNKTELMTLSLFDYLQPGYRYFLSMRFNGTLLHSDWFGFYRASYVYNNQTMYMAVSQFETTHARRAFPCFDEPSFKATFNVTLVRRTAYTALSNMPIRKTTDRGQGWKADEFERTPVMSTYTLAMVVCQYVSRERTTQRGTLIRVWAQPNYIKYADFALEITGPILEAYEDWTGIPYPISKLDQVVVKHLHSGAMENWGLVTYQEMALLVNPEFTSTTFKAAVASVIAHELAHQWFGNLVTMVWWDDTFLNEGFATYFGELVGVASLGAHWNMDQMFGQQILQVEGVDAYQYSLPVRRRRLVIPRNAFSRITYVKGGAILRMIKYFLGEATFRNGIKSYLREHAYGAVTKKDLYDALESQANADGTMTWDMRKTDLTDILDTWIEQANYPLVGVTDHRNGTVTVTQSRFLAEPINPKHTMTPSPFDQYIWEIPFTYADKPLLMKNSSKLEWIYRQNSTSFNSSGMSGWKLANVFLQGFYKVKYDNRTWADILRQLDTDHTVIPILSRAEFITDAHSLAQLGELDDIQSLSTTSYLKDDMAYLPWWTAFEHVMPFYEMIFLRTRTYPLFNRYILNLVLPNYNRLGWDNTKPNEHVEKYLRTLVLSQACKRNHPPCVNRALSLFRQFKSSPHNNPIHPDFRPFVYCTAVAHGGQEEFDFLAKIFFDNVRQESGDYMADYMMTLVTALSCVREPWLIDHFIDVMLSNGFNNAIYLLTTNPAAYDTLWRYLSVNLKTLPVGQAVGVLRVLDAITNSFSSRNDLSLLTDLLSTKMPDNVPNMTVKLTTKVEKNIAWIDENENEVQGWLRMVNAQGQGRRRRSTLSDLQRGDKDGRVRPGTNLQDALTTREALDDLLRREAYNIDDSSNTLDTDRFYRILPHQFV